MKAFVILLITLGAALAAQASTEFIFTSPADTYCGNASSGKCVVYADGTQSFELFWYWNGTTGNMQVTEKDATGATTHVYAGKLSSSLRAGVDNVMLTDSFGGAVTISYTGHTAKRLVTSGHNYWRFYTYVDSGKLTQ